MSDLDPGPSPLTGQEPFDGLDATVLDFWRWAMSDLRVNNVRGYLAEFLVAKAVGPRESVSSGTPMTSLRRTVQGLR